MVPTFDRSLAAVLGLLLVQSNSFAFVTINANRHAGRGGGTNNVAATNIIPSSRQALSTASTSIQHGVLQRDTIILFVAPQQLGSFEKLVEGDDDMILTTPPREKRRVWLYDFISTPKSVIDEQPSTQSSTVPYHEAWELQKQLVDHQLDRIGKRPSDPPIYSQFVPLSVDYDENYNTINGSRSTGSDTPPPKLIGCDSIIMLQHDPVYTLGTASDPSFIRSSEDSSEEATTKAKIPIVRIERGGEVTYHGPGQLTVYPVLDLRGYKQDVHWYMRALEEVILLALEKAGVQGATREDNLTGVWVSNKKIAALGIKARRWVTMHGLAINVDIRSLRNFEGIVPCGLEGRAVTCINEEIGLPTGFTVEEFARHVKKSLEEVFCVTLIPVKQS
jgi:lipoyl(octanoyl) transferase